MTGFLGALGEYSVMGIKMATEEINAAGGVMGRKLEVMSEDSVNPQIASTKAERMIERDRCRRADRRDQLGLGLTISQVAERNKKLFINIGARSDALRGKDCNRYMFHVEIQITMYVKTAGRSLVREDLVKGKKWISPHRRLLVRPRPVGSAKSFIAANGGQFAADKLVPTDATDFRPSC